MNNGTKLITLDHIREIEEKTGTQFIDQNETIANGTFFMGYTLKGFPEYFELLWNRWDKNGLSNPNYASKLPTMIVFIEPVEEELIDKVTLDDPFYEVLVDLLNDSKTHNQRFWQIFDRVFPENWQHEVIIKEESMADINISKATTELVD